jgi:hypothetical protein
MDGSKTAPRPRSERRCLPRQDCHNPAVICLATEPLGQSQTKGAPWNLSATGACVVLEPQYFPGDRLSLELINAEEGTCLLTWAEVKYAILIPSFREMYLTGCHMPDGLPDEELPHYV